MAAISPTIFKRVFIAFAALAGFGLLGVLSGYFYLRAELPKIRTLADYTPLEASRVFSDDGHLVGSFYAERRTVVPFTAIPKHVVQAFLAAEDANFYEHEGIDYFGIMRAVMKNLRPGAHLQGASTITQQTVKTLVLGPERSYARKLREMILARQLEQVLTKDEILYIYLNQIYFGSGAWGVEEAAQTYFGKSVRELNLAEGALLAAIPKNPGRYNIKSDPAAAKVRQHYVLKQMVERHWAESADLAQAEQAPMVAPPEPLPYFNKAPHYLEQVRRLLSDKYGEARVYQGGLVIYTGMSAKAQAAAQTALRQGLEDLARKQGYSGAPVRIEVDRLARYSQALHTEFTDLLKRRQATSRSRPRYGFMWDLSALNAAQLTDESQVRRSLEMAPLAEYQRVRAPVVRLDRLRHEAFVDLGATLGRLPLQNMQWARRFSPRAGTPAPRDPSDVLTLGDVVTVEIAAGGIGRNPERGVTVVLIPESQVDGAVVAIDPHSRLVRALVGGYRAEPGGFNRATQAVRQPGSAFKPIMYASALSHGTITPASVCPDSPVVIRDPWTGNAWKPENYEDGRYDGNITYRTALMRSKNTCSVRLMQKLGPTEAIATAHAMGINSKLPENLTLALGTGDVTPLELANAYATIAAGGLYAAPLFVRKVVDASGTILEDNRAEFVEALTPPVAYVLTSMMRSVVDGGTARRALVLDRPLAGKTGTSQESRNVWFSGFSAELVGTVYMGFDSNDPVGYDTGASAALPAWIRFMGAALAGEPASDFTMPEGVVTVRVDPSTGHPTASGVDEVFVQGTEPSAATAPLPSVFLEDDEKKALP